MKTDPLGNGFHAHVPPWAFSPIEHRSPQGNAYGKSLLEDITSFYSWFVSSWYLSDATPETSQKDDSSRKILSLIKRISEVSVNGGFILSENEELKAIQFLQDIHQDLLNGSLRKQDLPTALVQLMNDLTHRNPKAKVVSQTTELEYLLCINPSPHQSEKSTEEYRSLLSQIIQKVNPQMPDINASAISQGLSYILEDPDAIPDIHSAINNAIKHWL